MLCSLGKDEMESLCGVQAGSAVVALKEGTAPLLTRGFLWLQITQIISWVFIFFFNMSVLQNLLVWQRQNFRIAS